MSIFDDLGEEKHTSYYWKLAMKLNHSGVAVDKKLIHIESLAKIQAQKNS